MTTFKKFCPFLLGLLTMAPAHLRACTALAVAQGDLYFMAKNLDWPVGHGAVVVNPRGLRKESFFLSMAQTPLRWTARFASVSFNQAGIEFPYGGMNERGLTVEILILNESRFPTTDPAAARTNESQWIQHLLDTAGTLDEAVAAARATDVVMAFAPVHYFVCDANNECAAFEYIGGALQITRGPSLVASALANSSYAESVTHLRGFQGFGGTRPLPTDAGSLSRFVRAAAFGQQFRATDKFDARDQILGLLTGVASTQTQWQVVYNKRDLEVSFRSQLGHDLKTLSFASLGSLDCGPEARPGAMLSGLRAGDAAPQLVAFGQSQHDTLLQQSTFLPRDLRAGMSGSLSKVQCAP